jgi:hypothetical protein
MALRISDKVSIGLGGVITLLAVEQSLYKPASGDEERRRKRRRSTK